MSWKEKKCLCGIIFKDNTKDQYLCKGCRPKKIEHNKIQIENKEEVNNVKN